MKKYAWIVALLAALSLAIFGIGCGGGGDDDDVVGGEEAEPFVHNLGAFDFDLADNFQYGHGYQGVLTDSKLFKGEKIGKDEDYQLKIKFTLSRDLEQLLEVGLVDPTPEADYWGPLTWDADKKEKMTPLKDEVDEILKADKEYEFTIDFKTIKGSTAKSAAANALVFGTKGASTSCNTNGAGGACTVELADGNHNASGSGVQKKVTIKFTEFIFARGTNIDEEEIPDPPPVVELPEGAVNIGEPTLTRGGSEVDGWNDEIGSESQAVWGSVSFDDFIEAEYLVIETKNEIAGSMAIIWQCAEDKWEWGKNETKDILTSIGEAVDGITEVSTDKKKLSIKLSAINRYDVLIALEETTSFKLVLAYYSGDNKMAGLGIEKAYLMNK